jgi:predicted O-methyltransferase YrrM
MDIFKLDEFILLNKLETPNPIIFEKLVNDLSFYVDEAGEIGNVNYERGILLYGLIKKFKPKNILEFGTAKGFGTMSMAYAVHENNNNGKIFTIDLTGHTESIEHVRKVLGSHEKSKTTRKNLWIDTVPTEWSDSVKFIHGHSGTIVKQHDLPKIDFFYIDASHFYEAVKNDFFISLLLSNDVSIFVFDDYIDLKDFGVKKIIDNEISKYVNVTLIKTDKTNYHIKNNITKSDNGMCFFKSDKQKMMDSFGEHEIKSFVKKHGIFERRYAMRKKLNKRIPFLEKIRFRK